MSDSVTARGGKPPLAWVAGMSALSAIVLSGWFASGSSLGFNWARPHALLGAATLLAVAVCLWLESSGNPGESRSPGRFTAAFYLMSAVVLVLHHNDQLLPYLNWSGGALAVSGLARALWSAESARPGSSASSAAGLSLLLLGVLMLMHWPAWCSLALVPLLICDLLMMLASAVTSREVALPLATSPA